MSKKNTSRETFGLETGFDAVRVRQESRDLHGHHGEDDSNDHLASIYDGRDDQFDAVAPFIQQGLDRGERCLYVADDNARADVERELRERGVAVDDAVDSGALSIHTKADTYLRTGSFDQDAMLDFWREALAEAREENGYAGIRAAAEMTWALDGGTSLDRLVEYEAALNTVYPGEDYVVLCQYDRERFPREVLSDVIRTHPLIVYDGTVCRNFYYRSPDEFFDVERSSLDVDRTMEGLRSGARTRRTLHERERGLAALTELTGDLIRARPPEVCRRIARTARDVLPATVAAVWLYDETDDEMRLSAVDGSESLDESTVDASLGDLAWETFTSGESVVLDDRPDSARGGSSGPGLRSVFTSPVGRHGVFVVAAHRRDAFDATAVHLAKTLATNTETALNRATHEQLLEERERELERQNQRLERVNRINAIIREIDQALVQATTRSGVEEAVCERLATDDRFAFAWFGEVEPEQNRLAVRERAGTGRGYLDGVSLALDDEPDREPAVDAVRTRDVTVVSNVVDDLRTEAWRKQALSCGYHSVASIPLVYDDALYGVLTVYASESSAFDEMTRTVLGELGETIAHAINAVERKNALVSRDAVEVEFEISDGTCPLLALARAADCSVELRNVIPRDGESTLALVTVAGAGTDRVLDAVERAAGIDTARSIRATEDGCLVQLGVAPPFLAVVLAERGARVKTMTADSDAARAVVDVPTTVSVRTIDEMVSNTYSGTELVARREHSEPDESVGDRTRFREQLTDRQREVAHVAYYGGYFEQPRERSGADFSDALDISSQAFHKHLRTVQAKLLEVAFDEDAT